MEYYMLEDDNLGKRHHHLNNIVNIAVLSNKEFSEITVKSEQTDLDHLINIDIANRLRNVEYILKVLKSPDIFHVSRAIKNSVWLVTDEQYSHIIQPQYLEVEVFPYMTSRAKSKLLLHIRLHLKDEERVEQFYKYMYKEEKTVKCALKWLPNCSISFIIQETKKHIKDIDKLLLKKLMERSITVLDIFLENDGHYYSSINSSIFFLKTHTEEYLDIFEKSNSYHWPKFGKRHTKIILQKCADRLFNKFDKYADNVDISTVGKHLGPNKIKDFFLELAANEELKSWFTYKNVEPLIKLMPKEGKFEFLRNIFIKNEISYEPEQMNHLMCSFSRPIQRNKVYQWYRHAPFQIAFTELKKQLKLESSGEERGAILRVMLTTAGKDPNNLHSLLTYIYTKHINEPFHIKINFVNAVVSATDTHKYNDKCWNVLNELFYNLEVYNTNVRTDCDIQKCITAILVYKLVHKEPIPKIVKEKFNFDTLKKYKTRLSKDDNDVVFQYLYNNISQKIVALPTDNQRDFNRVATLLRKLMDLLKDWNKDLINYAIVLDKIKEMVALKTQRDWPCRLDNLYNKNKIWRKYLFQESIVMWPSEMTLLNALKHDPSLLRRHTTQFDMICFNDRIKLWSLLSKLRIYWPQTLAANLANSYRNGIERRNGHRALTRGLTIMLPQEELLELFGKYAPEGPTIIWSEINEVLLSLRRNFSQLMHNARPQPPPELVLRYAQGDYLQYALPSLFAIFCNLPSSEIGDHLPNILNSSVYLRKHGVNIAFRSLKGDNLINTISNIWQTCNDATIRANIFRKTFAFLNDYKDPSNVKSCWELLKYLIANLSIDEDPLIYNTLADIDDVPESIKAEYCIQTYNFFKKFPPDAECASVTDSIALSCVTFMDDIDQGFIETLILDFIDEWFTKRKALVDNYPQSMCNIVCGYILCCKSKDLLVEKCNKILKPLLHHCIALWNTPNDDDIKAVGKIFCSKLLTTFINMLHTFILKDYVLPLYIFNDILSLLESQGIEENYQMVSLCKITLVYLECYDEMREDIMSDISYIDEKEKNWQMWVEICPTFSRRCTEFLKEEINEHYFTIMKHLARTVKVFTYEVTENEDLVLIFLEELIKLDDIPSFLCAIKILPQHHYFERKDALQNVHKIISSHPSLEIRMHYNIKFIR